MARIGQPVGHGLQRGQGRFDRRIDDRGVRPRQRRLSVLATLELRLRVVVRDHLALVPRVSTLGSSASNRFLVVDPSTMLVSVTSTPSGSLDDAARDG